MTDRSHYRKPCPYDEVDVYRVLVMFEVTDPCIQHAVKKLLAAGKRGAKDASKDVAEAIESLQRWQQMRREEEDAVPVAKPDPNAWRNYSRELPKRNDLSLNDEPTQSAHPGDQPLVADYHATVEAAKKGDQHALQLLQAAAERELRAASCSDLAALRIRSELVPGVDP